MSWRRARVALWSSVALVGACAYYNGLYNANHLAADATRASREGRPAEARSLWEQAAVKAESVAARYPKSRHRDAALMLQGESLREAGACARAAEPLARVADSGRRADDRARASLALGACHVQLRDPARARAILGPLTTSPDPGIQQPARLWRARAELAEGNAAAALADLEGLGPSDVAFERAGALTLLDRGEEAAAALGSGSATSFEEARWRTSLDVLGRSRPDLASQLVDQVLRRTDVSSGAASRLLIADADRWLAANDQARALGRLVQAAGAARDSADGRVATARVAVTRLRTASSREAVAPIAAELNRISEDGGVAARIAEPALSVLRQVGVARESSSPDLRLFLAAEAVRDSLHAPLFAVSLFLEIAREYPNSAVAPKALLAAAQSDENRADSIIGVLERYADSPYVIAARGGAVAAFPAVEDSLRVLAAPAGATTKGPAPDTPRRLPQP